MEGRIGKPTGQPKENLVDFARWEAQLECDHNVDMLSEGV